MGLKRSAASLPDNVLEFAPCMGLKRTNGHAHLFYALFAPCMGLKSTKSLFSRTS